MESRWLKDALFSGMAGNAWKLGTVLSLGWFWVRTGGCAALYRGGDGEPPDFESIVAVEGAEVEEIEVPGFLAHQASTHYHYAVRKTNGCGDEERTVAAVTRVSIDAEGGLAAARPNGLFALEAEQAAAEEAELRWFYSPLEQRCSPVLFRIYHDGGSGQIDYNNAASTVSYTGRRFYSCTLGPLAAGRHLFAVRAEDSEGQVGLSYATAAVELKSNTPSPAQILSVACV